jgi:hypothetical protein
MKSKDLLQTNDAMVWAKEFVSCLKKNNWSIENIDEGLMVAWFANAMAAQEGCQLKNTKLTPSEAVYGFSAWLTMRPKAITLSARHDASGIAALVDQFCKANGFDAPRYGFEQTNLICDESGECSGSGYGQWASPQEKTTCLNEKGEKLS